MDNYYVLLIFRLLHICSGVFWAGTVLFMAIYIMPAANSLGADGGKFIQAVSGTRRFPTVMAWVATINIIAGLALFDHFSEHFSADFISSNHGIIMSFGGLCAIAAMTIGMSVNKPTVNKVAALGKAIAQSGMPPTPEQQQQLGAMRKKLSWGLKLQAVLLGATVVAMSIMKYF